MEPAFYGSRWSHKRGGDIPRTAPIEGQRERIMWRGLSKALRELLQIPGYGGSYRPDKHYMRGPGPKWHAKYGSLINKTSQPTSPSRPIASDIAEHRA